MRVYIQFDGVLDHIDVLSAEVQRAEDLSKCLEQAIVESPQENQYQIMKLKQLTRRINSFSDNVSRRKKLMTKIVDLLKQANIGSGKAIAEIEFEINELSNGESHE